jgi:hypothetical protein
MSTSIRPKLKANRGTISSKLGKALAQEVLAGDLAILEEAAALLAYADKQVRAGAGKIMEQVAVSRPDLVVGYGPHLLAALELPERQTRWMAIHTLGLCASLEPETALKAFPKAEAFIRQKSGACLWGATLKYLRDLGAVSPEHARLVFPLLEEALRDVPRQEKLALQGFLKLFEHADAAMRAKIAEYAAAYLSHESATVRRMARQVQRRVEEG